MKNISVLIIATFYDCFCWMFDCYIKVGDCSIRIFEFKISNVCQNISPERISEDFGYVVLHKILYLMVTNISWYHSFPCKFVQQPDYYWNKRSAFYRDFYVLFIYLKCFSMQYRTALKVCAWVIHTLSQGSMHTNYNKVISCY